MSPLSAVICAAVLFVAEVAAQSTLTTTFASNNGGSVGGMVFFDMSVTNPVGVTVKKFDINTASTGGELQVFVTPTGFTGVAATPLAWTHVASGVLVPAGMDNPSEVCLGAGFHLAPGSYGLALTAPTISHRYTNGGPGVPLSVSNADLAVAIGAAANAPFGGAQFMPRLWNGTVHYDLGQTSAFSCAYTRSFGVGCNEGATTWYQQFSDLSSFDLAGSLQVPIAVRATVTGPVGYIVLPATPAWYAPSGAALADNVSSNPGVITSSEFSEPIVLPFTFSFPGGSTNTVHASANGWVRLGATTQTFDGSLPAVHTLLTQDARLAPLWSLMDPSANAATNSATGIYYDIDPNGQAVYITWLDVADARTGSPPAGTTSINVQCVIYSNGSYEFRYGHVLIGSGTGPAIVGWSKGGIASPVPDPGSVDVSSSMPLFTNGPDNFALEHVVGTARLGSTLDLAVDRVEPLAPFAFLIVGNVENTAGQPLLGAGAPGCSVFTNTLAAAVVPVSGATGSGAFVIGIPTIPALVGTTFVSQYAALTQRNALNLSTSNGVSWTIGN